MITLHPATKRFSTGYVPMITLRSDNGQMIGSRTPQGGYREFRTFTNEYDALSEARLIVLRCAARHPQQLRACAF